MFTHKHRNSVNDLNSKLIPAIKELQEKIEADFGIQIKMGMEWECFILNLLELHKHGSSEPNDTPLTVEEAKRLTEHLQQTYPGIVGSFYRVDFCKYELNTVARTGPAIETANAVYTIAANMLTLLNYEFPLDLDEDGDRKTFWIGLSGTTRGMLALSSKNLTNGLQVCISVLDAEGNNLLHMEKDQVSPLVNHLAGGILRVSRDTSAWLATTDDEFERFDGGLTPKQFTVGHKGIQALADLPSVRVRADVKIQGDAYLENCLPSTGVGPYIALFQTLLGIYDGLLSQREPERRALDAFGEGNLVNMIPNPLGGREETGELETPNSLEHARELHTKQALHRLGDELPWLEGITQDIDNFLDNLRAKEQSLGIY